MALLVSSALLCCFIHAAEAQPKTPIDRPQPISPAEGRKQGQELVQGLLRIKPTENLTQNLLFKRTEKDDHETTVPVRFQIVVTATNFLSIYETVGGHADSSMKLTIGHAEGQPNQYWLQKPASAAPRLLGPEELTMGFAGSDFSASDLGLEFFHWSGQRITKKQMRKSVFCDVLESITPNPVPSGYSKVISWIGANREDELVLVHADAFDHSGKLLKQFDPRKLEKVNGSYQLEEMEIRNRQAGSSTKVEFQLK